ncbi:family 25 putative glycosyltransferase [Cercophora samala]|uniref:Family 25 putative glycosyltransferase n=1 Tax=Cercophora samala TaxID=330535 RepID=A0AA40CYK9_9PEZI|nr:family 25 putative glycosyltransferase [Cercophora samala]
MPVLFGHRYLAFIVVVFLLVFLIFKPLGTQPHGALDHMQLRVPGKAFSDVLNSTLGFQELFVLNLPERSDRRDAMTLSAALTKLDVKWIDGIDGKDVPDRVLPGDSWDKKISKGNKGSWRAHMDALQRIVRENLTSALILEDDADWDIRLKQQMQVFAQAARALTQPTPKASSTGKPLSATEPQSEISISQIPTNLRSRLTPYGDNWDVLWLGHCGTDFPSAPTILPHKDDASKPKVPLLRITIPNDPTVPDHKHLKPHPFALQDSLAKEYPPHTRVVHSSYKTTCTQAYAVSQQGARKLLYQFGLKTLTTGWDLMLGDWCDGLYPQEKQPICVTVQPPLFSHHYGKGAASDITAPGGGFVNKDKEMTPYVRLSVRVNMERLVQGVGVEGLVDQWEDPE